MAERKDQFGGIISSSEKDQFGGRISSSDTSVSPTTSPKNFLVRTASNIKDLALEGMAGFDRNIASGLDVIASPLIAAERQIRPYAQATLGQRAFPDSPRAAYRQTEPFSFREQIPEKGAFAGEGALTDVASGTGELGSLAFPLSQGLTYTKAAIPAAKALGSGVIETTKRVGKELLTTTPKQEFGYGTLALAGGEGVEQVFGDDYKVAGEFLAPMIFDPMKYITRGVGNALDSVLNDPKSLQKLTVSLNAFSDDISSDVLAEALAREGISVDEAIKKLDQLGPDAIPADLNANFRNLLRLAGNVNPNVQGESARKLKGRQEGQAERVEQASRSALGSPDITVDEAVAALKGIEYILPDGTKTTVGQRVTDLYDQARKTNVALSPTLRTRMQGSGSLGDAAREAERNLADVRETGEVVSNFHLIDETKHVLDDQIRAETRLGNLSKVRNLIRIKNELVIEADAKVPGYAEARKLYAGEKALQNAAERGEKFLLEKRRIVIQETKNMSAGELEMYRIGAMQAITDSLDATPITTDSMKKLFGKNGSVDKLRSVFPNEEAFQSFKRTMEREAEFRWTDQAVRGNSTTLQQYAGLQQEKSRIQRVIATGASVFSGSPVATSQQIAGMVDGLSQDKMSEEFAVALRNIADILLSTGIDPQKLRTMIENGNTIALRRSLDEALSRQITPRSAKVGSQAVRSGVTTQIIGEE